MMVLTKNITFPVRLSDATMRPAPVPVEPVVDHAALERERFDKLLTLLERRAAEAEVDRQVPLNELARLATEIGVAAAAKLTHAKIAADEFGIETLVRGAIERLPTRQPVDVTLHPDDLVLLQKRLGDPAEIVANRTVRFAGDDQIARGDVKAALGDVEVWSELSTQLAELRDRLMEGLPAEIANAARGL
jgi:flagellar biosynthesis/type III secretory pathway protein FliH